jgi:hypothetical protein
LHLAQPKKDFLIRETVKRTSKTVERCAEGEERVRKSGANEFTGVCRDITTFLVTGK